MVIGVDSDGVSHESCPLPTTDECCPAKQSLHKCARYVKNQT
ncbi:MULTISPECIES: hypothetical protein [Oxynema]|nr:MULTISPECIES: hypothetical protein [Oxynema]